MTAREWNSSVILGLAGQQIIRDLISAIFHVHENAGICNIINVFGYTDLPKKLVICAENIRNSGWDMKRYINEGVVPEAFHAVQICNKNEPLGIIAKTMPLPTNKLQDVKNSAKFTKRRKVAQRA